MSKYELPDRIESKIVKVVDGCWLWTGALTAAGYGAVNHQGSTKSAHRVIYELLIGSLPDPKVLECDHLCRVRSCVNPDHIELVTRQENIMRGRGPNVNRARFKAQTHCKRGHEFTDETTYIQKGGGRSCRKCHCLIQHRYLERKANHFEV